MVIIIIMVVMVISKNFVEKDQAWGTNALNVVVFSLSEYVFHFFRNFTFLQILCIVLYI